MNFSCVKCTNGMFGDGIGGSTQECTIVCENGCETCFDAGLTNCFSCTVSSLDSSIHYFLQP